MPPDATKPVESLVEMVDRIFAPGGPIAAVIDGFEPRASQREMADAVASTLEDGGVLLVEAGTGTGKTLAYLVPAILSRKRVLVSTGTKNLQEQIYFKDLPVLERALGVPFTATCMKGRGNYLCLHRFTALREEAAALAAGAAGFAATHDARMFLTIIDEWAARTETGDRAEIADLPEDLPLWNDVAASAENCLGRRLPPPWGLLRDAHAPARRGIGRGDRQSPPALRGCGLAQPRVRRGDSGLSPRSARRSAPARGRGDAVFRRRREHLSASRSS